MTEEWRICSEFPGYEVSSLGRVRGRFFIRGAARAYNQAALDAWGEHAFLNEILEAAE